MADRILTTEQLIEELKGYNHNELHVHHTFKPDHSNWRQIPDGLYWNKSMRNYHINTRGFVDIAQHVTLLPDGLFVTGRSFEKTPASIEGHNTPHGLPLMVEMIGNFDIGNDKFEGAQKNSMIALASWFDKQGKYIRFHRENASKTCPGTSINKVEFMGWVKELASSTPKGDEKPMADQYIRAIQAALRDHGIDPGPIDGIPGPKTLSGVREAVNRMTLAERQVGDTGVQKRLDMVKELAKKILEV